MDSTPPATSVPPDRRAIVIGASIAGLLAARVLADHYDEVVLVERDVLPEHAAARKGTPQAVHPHGLLARGLQVIEGLFPGFTDALLAQGAVPAEIGRDIAIDADRRRFAPGAVGTLCLAASRLTIEAEIRRRLRARAGVRFLDGTTVDAPVHAAGRVTGVRLHRADAPGAVETVAAGLVVDCGGRGSRTPAWLREWGYAPPDEERVTVGLAYTSAYFRRDPDDAAPRAVLGIATPDHPRPFVLIAQEPDAAGVARWVVGLGGYAGDHVEVSPDGMRRRAEALGTPEIAALTTGGEPIGPPISYQFPHSQRRRYERLRAFPAGFLVMGDAITSFNPAYGQGMTVAACEALALRDALGQSAAGLAARFFRSAAKIVDVAWQMSAGGDLALPQVPGKRTLPTRLINAYVGRVQAAAVEDPVVTAAFAKVMHMLAPPTTLMRPAMLWRVLRRREAPVRPVATALSPAPAVP